MTNKFNPSISIIRVLSMLSIIVGHWLTMKGINHFQFGAIGVQVFLFISGWLHSDKHIDKFPKWFLSKAKRILFPYYVGLILIIVLRFMLHVATPKEEILIHAINLQGLSKIFSFAEVSVITGYGHTWFLTVLAICYLLTACLKKYPEIDETIRNNWQIWLLISIGMQVILMYLGIQIGGLLCYFYGYYMKHEVSHRESGIWPFTVAMLLSTALRFLVYKHSHESVAYNIIFTWSFIALGIWLSLLGMLICERFSEKSFHIATSKIWRLLDLASYPLFLMHYMFLKGDLSVEKWFPNNSFLQLLLFMVLSTLGAAVVMLTTDWHKTIQIIKNGLDNRG